MSLGLRGIMWFLFEDSISKLVGLADYLGLLIWTCWAFVYGDICGFI